MTLIEVEICNVKIISINSINNQEKEPVEKPKPKVPEIKAPGSGGQQLEAPKIEVIREPSPDRKNSLNPGVYCSVYNFIKICI